MKKLFILCCLVLIASVSRAAKAYNLPVTISQSDGTQLTIKAYGDEDFHYCMTLDRVLLYQVGTDFYIANINDKGVASATTQLAHNNGMRSEKEIQLIKEQDLSKFFSRANTTIMKTRAARREPIQYNSTYFPHTGTPKALVILVEFSDTVFRIKSPKAAFNQYLNGTRPFITYGNGDILNYGSVSEYFNDMSFGTFKPKFDIYGPVKLNNPLSTYGGSRSSDPNNNNDNVPQLIKDACNAVNDSVDFSAYDQNKDGKVDLVYVIYAGYSQSQKGNSADCIWPQSWYGDIGSYDGVTVYRYGVNNELNGVMTSTNRYINGIGLFCHEFSHCLGLPDLYSTQTASDECQSADNQELEFWDLMDGGEYVQNGRSPSEYSAWEREALGWLSVDTLKDTTNVVLKTIDNGGKAYRIMNDNDATGKEYFIVENVQLENWNNCPKYKGHGMLVYHVDYDANDFSLSLNCVNNTLGHPRMTLVAADGLLMNAAHSTQEDHSDYYAEMKGDPFPGTKYVHFLTDTSTVKPIIYTGSLLKKPILNITETDGVVTFDFLGKKASTGINYITIATKDDNKIYSIDGRYVGTDQNVLPKGIYIKNKKKFIIK
jgi:immune inhibitor A